MTDHGFEPLIVTLGFLAALITSEVLFVSRKAPSQATVLSEPDKQLFGDFLEILPSNGMVSYLIQASLTTPFEREMISPLDRFLNNWQNAEHEFLDDDVEQSRLELIEAAKKLSNAVGKNTFPVKGNSSYQSVEKEWQWKNPQAYREAVQEIDDCSSAFVAAHQDLVRNARKKIGSE